MAEVGAALPPQPAAPVLYTCLVVFFFSEGFMGTQENWDTDHDKNGHNKFFSEGFMGTQQNWDMDQNKNGFLSEGLMGTQQNWDADQS